MSSPVALPTGSALAEATPRPYWLDRPEAPAPRPPLDGEVEADLLVVGAGLTGLWAALQALEEDPSRSVVLLEGERVAFGASGRNGGFCMASLTHGISNGLSRWPDEMPVLERLGRENLDGIRAAVREHGIDCDWEDNGAISVATAPHQVPWLDEEGEALRRHGWTVERLDREQMRAEVASPTYEGGIWIRDESATIDPAKLCCGLAGAVERLGGRVHEGTPVLGLKRDGAGVRARTPGGTVRARRVLLATSAFPPLLKAIRAFVVPVYDYVLMTEPLDEAQRDAIGWRGRQALWDMGNQFHYYRQTADHRILWGGYDAIYHYRNGMGPHLDQRPASHEKLAGHFFETFPQLEGLRFSHRWGGAIDTCSRFSAMWGTSMGGRVTYVVGFTGLGVGASRFGARVGLDLADGRDTERTRLEMVRKRPLPFPPEPLRYAAIELTRRELDRADRNEGRRGLWLRTLDRLGLGFDS
jgi:glycine/D-amino acid oxidase-like deaminating enzyme